MLPYLLTGRRANAYRLVSPEVVIAVSQTLGVGHTRSAVCPGQSASWRGAPDAYRHAHLVMASTAKISVPPPPPAVRPTTHTAPRQAVYLHILTAPSPRNEKEYGPPRCPPCRWTSGRATTQRRNMTGPQQVETARSVTKILGLWTARQRRHPMSVLISVLRTSVTVESSSRVTGEHFFLRHQERGCP
jgi:hypothetical protein